MDSDRSARGARGPKIIHGHARGNIEEDGMREEREDRRGQRGRGPPPLLRRDFLSFRECSDKEVEDIMARSKRKRERPETPTPRLPLSPASRRPPPSRSRRPPPPSFRRPHLSCRLRPAALASPRQAQIAIRSLRTKPRSPRRHCGKACTACRLTTPSLGATSRVACKPGRLMPRSLRPRLTRHPFVTMVSGRTIL